MFKYRQYIQAFILGTFLPALYGCQGGGGSADNGGASLSSFVFGAGNAFGGDDTSSSLPLALNSFPSTDDTTGALTAFANSTDSNLALIHNPEPATMLLLGGGIMAMTYAGCRKDHREKPRK